MHKFTALLRPSFKLTKIVNSRVPALHPYYAGISAGYATKLKEYESLYDIMETEPTAGKTEIRESWLRLSMMYHPDLNKDSEDAEATFMKIKEAYEILIDDDKRREYNDTIGFHHPDPPPDYHHEWTLQGEKNKSAAKAYMNLWNEESIRELMSSEKLREVDWDEKAPAERYRILVEEEERQQKLKEEMDSTSTPSIKQNSAKYTFLLFIGAALAALAYRMEIIEEQEFIRKAKLANEGKGAGDRVLTNGTLVTATARQEKIFYSYFGSLSSIKKKLLEENPPTPELGGSN